MIDLLLDPSLLPFAIALGLLFGLMALELISALLGGTLLGLDNDADLDLDLDVDLDGPDGIDFTSLGLDSAETAVDLDLGESATGPISSTDWLGISKVPTLIWVAALLLGFGLIGVIIQTAVVSIFGTALPAALAILPSAFGGLWFTRKFAGVFAAILPKSESSALSIRHLGRRRGVVSQGTASRGKPAEVRVIDGHGNTHHLRAEPLRDDDVIPQGADVIVMRKSLDEGYRMVALST